MKNIQALLAGALLAISPVASLSAEESTPPAKIEQSFFRFTDGSTIKVRIAHKIKSALLEVKGAYKVYKAKNGALLSFGHVGKRFVIHPMQEGLRWGEEYPDIFQIAIVPDDPDTTLYVDGIQYKGALYVYQSRNKISIVNEVDIEDYTKSLLGPLFDTALESEAMAALAITCRTQAYHQVITAEKANLNQGLWHITREEAKYFGYGVTGSHNGVDEAVDSTWHIVMEQVSPDRGMHSLPLTFSAGWNSSGLMAQVGQISNTRSASGQLSLNYAQDMAKKGHDAKRILYTTFPNTKISVVNKPIQDNLR